MFFIETPPPAGCATTAHMLLAHGAGAPMDHPFMENMATHIAAQGVHVARFEFPYMVERRTTGKKRPPNPQKVLLACWQAAIKHWCEHTANQPLYMAGKSMGGRMATLLPDTVRAAARGIICLGYPFHPPGKPEKTRTAHLQDFSSPLLICQGERDTMGCQTDVQSYTLDPNITIAWLPDGDHSLTPRKKSGYTAQDNMHTAAQTIGSWIRQHD